MYIKDFNRFLCNKTKNKNKKSANIFYNVLVVKKFDRTQGNCLIINCKQIVKLKSGSIEFKIHFKQLAVPSNINADFESLLKEVQSSDKSNTSYKY